MVIKKNPAWVYYIDENDCDLDPHKCGKWMYFFDKNGIDFAETICRKAIEDGIVAECKHTRFDVLPADSGVCCFYLEGDDISAHKRVIAFFMRNNLIKKTKAGKYYNISFKFDDQTRAGEYGEEFTSEIKLANFIDLSTGEWLK